MDGFGRGGRGAASWSGGVGESSEGGGLFDASRYAFFGKDGIEEIELGGLEEADIYGGLGGNGENYQYSSPGEKETTEAEGAGSLSEIDDLASTFSKINKVVSDPRNTGVIGERRSFSRESSTGGDWSQDSDISNWQDLRILEAENAHEAKRWWSHPNPSDNVMDSRSLYRASSYPQPQPDMHLFDYPNDQVIFPKSSVVYPPPGGSLTASNLTRHLSIPSLGSDSSGFQSPFSAPNPQSFSASTNLTRHSSIPSLGTGSTGGFQSHFSASNPPSFSASPLQLAAHARQLQYGGIMGQFSPSSANKQWQQNNRPNHGKFFSGDHPHMFSNYSQHQMPNLNGLMNPKLIQQHHQQMMHPMQQPLSHYSQLQSQLINQHPPTSQMLNKLEMAGMSDIRDQRSKVSTRGRHSRYPQQAPDISSQKSDGGWPQFRSKYMSADEIESVLKQQHAATHGNDPYIDDYYHQACLAKNSIGKGLKHHFSPANLRDISSRRSNKDAHAYLKIDSLGRITFSSIRRPRPLLEVNSLSFPSDNPDQRSSVKPLEEEPMLAARITVEDGLCLLLDVDDIDRLLQSSQPSDGGSQLRKRRQVLLEGLAASLQLVDPLGPGRGGPSAGLDPIDDVVFLRIVSLSKGRKLITRFLQLLFPGSELTRIVCMAIFRRLRFLFGALPLDSTAAETTTSLAATVSSCVCSMDLNALSACLAAIVCSKEQPPLRPLGSSNGDGASVIIKSVLDRATYLLDDPHSSRNYTMPNRSLWQASFDAFFGLLTKSCLDKYDTIVQALISQTPNTYVIGAEASKAIGKEMPVELLRASLPHTGEDQRKLLMDFAQRSMPITGFSGHGSATGQINSESVPG